MSIQDRSDFERDPVLVSFSGELDAAESAFGAEILGRIDGGADRLIVDLLNVTFIDSSIIGTLVLAHRKATAVEGWVRLVYTNHVVRRVIEMCGLDQVFPQYATVEAAWRSDRDGRSS